MFTKFGGGIYDVTSALKYYCRYYYKAPAVLNCQKYADMCEEQVKTKFPAAR